MLAQRASTNGDLKILMKVVASGNANHDQLKIFQSHIYDLTDILQRQKQTEGVPTALPEPSPRVGGSNLNTQSQPARSSGIGVSASDSQPTANPFRAASVSQNTTYSLSANPSSTMIPNQPTNVFVKPKTYALPRSDKITGMAIEFAAGSGDRFLLPKYRILEHLPGNWQVVCSFLVVRKGNVSYGGKYETYKYYYETVTIRILTDIQE